MLHGIFWLGVHLNIGQVHIDRGQVLDLTVVYLFQGLLKILMGKGYVATQRVDDATQLGRLVELTHVATALHLGLHLHGLAQRTIEVVVVDIIEYLVLPAEVIAFYVVFAQQVLAVVGDGFVELLLVVLIKSVADHLQQSGCSGVFVALFLGRKMNRVEARGQ